MSLAPSPDRDGLLDHRLVGELAEGACLGRRVDDVADHSSGERAVDDLERVGADEVELEFVCERVDDLTEAARDDAAAEAEPAQRPDRGAGTGSEFELLGNFVDDAGRQTREGRDALFEGLREVDLTAHRSLGDLADLVVDTGVRGEHLDDLALDERGVDVEDDQALGTTRETAALHRDVDVEAAGEFDEGVPQGGVGLDAGVGRGDHQFEAGERVVGDAADRIDVRALGREGAAHRSQRLGTDRLPSTTTAWSRRCGRRVRHRSGRRRACRWWPSRTRPRPASLRHRSGRRGGHRG